MRYKAKSVAVLQLALVVCQIECERNKTRVNKPENDDPLILEPIEVATSAA